MFAAPQEPQKLTDTLGYLRKSVADAVNKDNPKLDKLRIERLRTENKELKRKVSRRGWVKYFIRKKNKFDMFRVGMKKNRMKLIESRVKP